MIPHHIYYQLAIVVRGNHSCETGHWAPCQIGYGERACYEEPQTERPPAESWWVQKLSADFTAD